MLSTALFNHSVSGTSGDEQAPSCCSFALNNRLTEKSPEGVARAYLVLVRESPASRKPIEAIGLSELTHAKCSAISSQTFSYMHRPRRLAPIRLLRLSAGKRIRQLPAWRHPTAQLVCTHFDSAFARLYWRHLVNFTRMSLNPCYYIGAQATVTNGPFCDRQW